METLGIKGIQTLKDEKTFYARAGGMFGKVGRSGVWLILGDNYVIPDALVAKES